MLQKNELITKCPKCKKECEEIFFEPKDPKIFDRIEFIKEEKRRIGYKYEGVTTQIDPYIDGGTFLICKNCCLNTFYPREYNEAIEQ